MDIATPPKKTIPNHNAHKHAHTSARRQMQDYKACSEMQLRKAREFYNIHLNACINCLRYTVERALRSPSRGASALQNREKQQAPTHIYGTHAQLHGTLLLTRSNIISSSNATTMYNLLTYYINSISSDESLILLEV